MAAGRGCPTGSHSTSTQLVRAADDGEDGSYIHTDPAPAGYVQSGKPAGRTDILQTQLCVACQDKPV